MKLLILFSLLLTSCSTGTLKRRTGPVPSNVWYCPDLVQKNSTGDFFRCWKPYDTFEVTDPQ